MGKFGVQVKGIVSDWTTEAECDTQAQAENIMSRAIKAGRGAQFIRIAPLCNRCGSEKPAGQSCGCFDNHSE